MKRPLDTEDAYLKNYPLGQQKVTVIMEDQTRAQFKRLFAGATLMLTGTGLLQLDGSVVLLGMVGLLLGVVLFLTGYFSSP